MSKLDEFSISKPLSLHFYVNVEREKRAKWRKCFLAYEKLQENKLKVEHASLSTILIGFVGGEDINCWVAALGTGRFFLLQSFSCIAIRQDSVVVLQVNWQCCHVANTTVFLAAKAFFFSVIRGAQKLC